MKKRYGILASAVGIALLVAAVASPQGGGQTNTGGQTGAQGGQPQSNTPAQAPGALTGQVLSTTSGEPLRKVSLTLRPQGRGGSAASTTTDASGNFRFATVDPGTYTLTGERSGFVRATLGEDRGQAQQITITSGQTSGGIQLKLLPHSVITGRVYDIDGDPVQGAQVTVMHYSIPRGQRQLTNVAQAATNDLGEYRVPALPPGRYYISASDRGVLTLIQTALTENIIGPGGGPGGPGIVAIRGAAKGGGPGGRALIDQLRNSDPNPEAYVTTYYPRTVDASGATPLDLAAGSETRGIDIGLLKGRNYSVSGVIENVPVIALPQQAQANNNKGNDKQKGKQFQGPGGVIVNLVPRTSNVQASGLETLLGGTAQVNPDGTFQLRGVRPGAYYLRAESRVPQQASRLSARVAVDVSSSDVTNVRVRLSPPLEVNGRITPDKADNALNLAQMRINFVPSTPGGRGGQQQRIDIAADGKFQAQLDTDTYSVELAGTQTGYYLKTVKLAGREVADNILDLNLSGSAVDLVVANDSASITGTVQKSNGDPVQSARVTVVPANNSQRRDLYKSANSAADGTFTVSGLPPGNYKVFAWEEVETNAWMDPEFRRPFETLGTTATIRDGAGPTLQLRVIGKAQINAVQ